MFRSMSNQFLDHFATVIFRHTSKHFETYLVKLGSVIFLQRTAFHFIRRIDVIDVVWIVYFFLHRVNIKGCHDHIQGSCSRPSITRVYKSFLERIEMDELAEMIMNPLITGDLEADETWLKVGAKYPGRGRNVSKKYSMVHMF